MTTPLNPIMQALTKVATPIQFLSPYCFGKIKPASHFGKLVGENLLDCQIFRFGSEFEARRFFSEFAPRGKMIF